MNIIGITGKDSGCGYHRVILPLGFMQDIKGYVTNYITEDKMEGWDILLYNRMCQYDGDWSKTKELLGCKVVLDLDDYWKLPPNHMNYQQYEKAGKKIEENIRQADLVTVTNEALAEKVRPFNKNVMVFPNGIPFGHNQFIEDRRESDRVRIFWCGSITHEHDLKILSKPLERIKIHKDKIQMVLGGFQDAKEATVMYHKGEINQLIYESALYTEDVWKRMFSYFTLGGQLPYMKIHGTSPVSYMQMYENADVMVIPLEDSVWHACKSNLKILEAASKRIPVIVSDVAPYNQDKDAPVLWVKKQSDWFKHLNYLILNPAERIRLGNELYEWAKSKYDLERINERRAEAFRNLCEAPAHLRVLSENGGVGELSPAHSD